jgi:hypothetical protein
MKTQSHLILPLMFAALALTGACREAEEPTPAPAAAPAAAQPAEESFDLGTRQAGSLTIRVAASRMDQPGAEVELDIAITPAMSSPTRVQAWIGPREVEAAAKATIPPEGPGAFHGDLDAPAALRPEDRLWVEFRDPQAGRVQLEFPVVDEAFARAARKD